MRIVVAISLASTGNYALVNVIISEEPPKKGDRRVFVFDSKGEDIFLSTLICSTDYSSRRFDYTNYKVIHVCE